MPLNSDALHESERQFLDSDSNFWEDIKWLEGACGENRESDVTEALEAILAMIASALRSAPPLMGITEWQGVADYLHRIKDSDETTGLDRDAILQFLRDCNMMPLMLSSSGHTVSLDAATLLSRMREDKKEIASIKQSVGANAEEGRDRIHAAEKEIGQVKEEAVRHITKLSDDLTRRYNLTADTALFGSYDVAAKAEREQADKRTKIARREFLAAVLLAILIIVVKLCELGPNGLDGHLVSIPIFGSPVGILLYMAIVETKAARTHSHNYVRWAGLSLQLKSLKPYLNDLAEKAEAVDDPGKHGWMNTLLGDVSKKLFHGDIGPYTPTASTSHQKRSYYRNG